MNRRDITEPDLNATLNAYREAAHAEAQRANVAILQAAARVESEDIPA